MATFILYDVRNVNEYFKIDHFLSYDVVKGTFLNAREVFGGDISSWRYSISVYRKWC